ncbi:MAG: exopolyphosphatase [Gammaproteobacteria bacterium]
MPNTVAAVDLGSNSFHMIVARAAGDRLRVIDRMKTMVRLAAGLDDRNRLGRAVMDRAVECLEQFGQRLSGLNPENVRVVGTNTLRKARNAPAFIARAQAALGHPIDVISGAEEARLIYLGVAHSIDGARGRRLVIDIGGGSTEVILGRRFEPQLLESLYIGCVGMSRRFFADGRIDADRMRRAKLAARQEFEHIEAGYRKAGWNTAIGASGTILAVREICANHRWSHDGITAAALAQLESALCRAGHADALHLNGLDPERAPVFAGGVAILSAAFEALGIETMQTSSGALREGLLYDLIGRMQHEDARERTVSDLLLRHHADVAHATRVARTVRELFKAVARRWRLDPEADARLLNWAALLHEIGVSVSHGQYHKHGGYLLRHMDMPGFSSGEQVELAALVRAHRRKFPVLEEYGVAPAAVGRVRCLAVLLRVAVALHRSRSTARLPKIEVQAQPDALRLGFPARWLDRHPLSRADLAQEADYLQAAGVRLRFR